MKQVLRKRGQTIVEDVPSPMINENEILVQVHYSCISAGTEMSMLQHASVPLYKKVLKQPEKIVKTLQMLRSEGLSKTITRVKQEVDSSLKPIGSSASGVVLKVGAKISDIKQGDMVACAGASIANHAEFIAVPRNLLVKVPEEISLQKASTVTVGAIAMQGVRRADPKLGDFVAVVGLGILGQITFQILKANGCKVIGVDLDERRLELSRSAGIDKCLNPSKDDIVSEAVRFANGHGVDSVIITASTESSELINQTMAMSRRKGKVVIVGAVGLNLLRNDFYTKELDVLMSTSYGPGRYDNKYEMEGVDYPYAYVRWTENRNMDEYLRLISDKKIDISSLIEKVYSIEDAPKAYEELSSAPAKPLIVLLEYNSDVVPCKKIVCSNLKVSKENINVGLIGAGAFAKGTHLPGLKKLNNLYNTYAIVDKIGSNAKGVAQQYGSAYIASDYKELIKDEDVDLIMITTRHNLHSQIAVEAAKAGKAVFVEKPMAVNKDQLYELVKVLEETKIPFTVGFNRRFSPFVARVKNIVNDRTNPMIVNYRMNAGYIPLEHWVHTEEGAGRNIGEACHIYDLFNFLTDCQAESVSAFSIEPKTEQYGKNDNFVATIKYKDGSVCNLIYTALGTNQDSKEQMDIYVDGKIIRLDDYKKLELLGTTIKPKETKEMEKGYQEELVAFAKAIQQGDGYSIPLWQLIQATEISFEIEEMLYS